MAIRIIDSNSILKNKEIRKAMNYSINRSEIAHYLKYNLVLPANKGFVSDGMPNYDTSFTGYSFDIYKAKNILSLWDIPIQKSLNLNSILIIDL
jgi:ABC-type transport system substrate-binding protein